MGLDMYLEARKYVSKVDWNDMIESTEEKVRDEYKQVAVTFPANADKYSQYSGASVSLPVGYWRKANAIHQWFVDNVQGGEDDCRETYVNRGALVELRDICKQILSTPKKQRDDKADELLPTQSGFFFGSTEYDEWYYAQLKDTVKMLDHVLKTFPDNGEYSFYYTSSW